MYKKDLIIFRRNNTGQLLIEMLIAIAISSIMLPALLTGLMASRSGKPQQSQRVEAAALVKEAEEVVRSVREKGWANFSVNGTYYPSISGNAWTFSSGVESVNGFTRSLVISDVYRDINGVIVSSASGTLDSSTKKIDIAVTWGQPYASAVNSTLFVTRYANNTITQQTTQTEFQAGTLTNVSVTNTSGGEITLAPNTKGKWCSPTFSSSAITLPDGPPVAVAATASASTISTPNDVFVATAPTVATSIKLAHIQVPANIDPPNPLLRGIFTMDPAKYSNPSLVPVGIGLDNSFITNAVKYYKSSSGKLYALIATTKTDKEVIAVLVDDGNSSNDNTNNGEYQDYVNKIYKYQTFFNTTIYSTSGSSDTGFANPSANSSDSGGDNDGYQSNPTRAYSDNSSFASDSNSGNGNGTNCTGNDKDKHRFYNYGFNIPTGATIDGIEVRLDAKVDNTSGSPKMCVQLSWDGGTTWTTTKSTGTLTTNEATYTLGGVADIWGHTWSDTDLNNSNFRLRVIDVASDTTRDFSLDWAAVKVHYTGGVLNDQSPYGLGASSLSVLDDKGYVTSGGFLYVFDLSNIDSKTSGNGLDMVGCRIELDGYDCNTSTSRITKYSAGSFGTNFQGEQNWLAGCMDGGNVEIYADNDIYPVRVGSNTYVDIAVGGGTNPEFEIADVSSIPSGGTSPAINNSSCGTIANGNAQWKRTSSLDFNSLGNTQEAANSVYATSDGNRAYISSNGGIDANNDGKPDSWQFYVIDTSNKTSPRFLSTSSSATGSIAASGYYYGAGANAQLYPRRSLTVFNGSRAVLVGKDGVSDSNNAQEYQVLDISNEASPAYCSGLDYNQGFNDLASVTEADNDKFVYMVSSSGGNQLKIIQGGPDGSYLDSGTYESSTVDLGAVVALNRLTADATVPANSTIKYQVAGALPLNDSCSGVSFTYVGPDGTSNTYFGAGGGAVPLNSDGVGFENPARCVRYKAFLSTTDFNVTPVLLDATINYSP